MTHTHLFVDASSFVMIALVASLVAGPVLFARGRRPSRRLVSALALLVALIDFETALHSVHHLSDSGSAASCVLQAAADTMNGASPDLADAGDPRWVVEPSRRTPDPAVPPRAAFPAHAGRAPPAA